MKHDIIKTDDYLLVVDESEIKGWYYDAYINKVKHGGGAEYGENSITKNIIAHLPLNGSPILEGVDLLPPLPLEEDVEKLAREYAQSTPDNDPIRILSYLKGYNQAKEKYKYTEEDLRKAMFLYSAWITGGTPSLRIAETAEERQEQIIQYLSQPKMPIGFEQEMNETFVDAFTYDRLRRFYGKEPKTTTTPEGHTQWVGTYIFN